MVSIRTRHRCRVMHEALKQVLPFVEVSIRTRHRCRVMQYALIEDIDNALFQSAPGIAAG